MSWGQGQEMTLTFHTFLSSISCLHLPTFRWLAANPLFSLFPTEKPKLPNLTLPLNRSRSTQGHHLNKLWWAGVPDATYQVSWEIGQPVMEKKIFEGFSHIWAWQPSWSCDPDAGNNFRSPYPRRAHIKFGLDWSRGFVEEDVWKCERTTEWTVVVLGFYVPPTV